ncbi:unnamed protein product [Arctia plantaginis]|nr:unnamed protein product [Arctia plantaginis]
METNLIEGIDQYVEHLKDLGLYSFKQIGKIIIKKLNVEKEITKEVNEISEKFVTTIKNYCNHVTETYGRIEQNSTLLVDDEFLFRNILETACKYLYRAQQHLLKTVTKEINSTKDNVEKSQLVVDIINKQYIQDKKGELKYICKKYEVCATYPAFTDYIENFIIELLKLSDDKLTTFMYLLKNILETNNDFQIITYRVQERNINIIKVAQDLCVKTGVKKCLSAVQAVLNQRFKILVCPDKALSVKIQAARILLEVMDKTFHHSHDVELLFDYGTTIDAIKTWNKDESSSPTTVVKLFFNQILRTSTLSENSLKGALIEVIVTGEPDYDGFNKLCFISEVISLESYEFQNFVELLNETINFDEDFVELINANDNIIKIISSAFASPGNVKESLEVLRALLIHRYKIVHITNLKRKRKIQAVRTILDTLEKVLSFDHGKQFDLNFNVAINAVKRWSKVKTEDESSDDISDFMNSIFKVLKRSGDYFIPYLIETILTGKITEQEEYKDLFRDGSKNVFAAEETF